MNIVLTGSLAFDRIMVFPGYFKEHILPDKIHNLNVAFNIEKLEEKKGGTAGNIAYSLALLGERPRIVASAGNDFDQYLAYMEKMGLPVDGVEVQADTTTASAYIITDKSDNQITGFFMGAMTTETKAEVQSWDNDTVVCLSPGNKQDMLRYSEECRQAGTQFIFDPGQTLPFLEPDEIKTIMQGAYILIVNDYELEMIMNRTEMSEEDIRAQVEVLIVTLGKEGSKIKTKEEEIIIPACKTDIVKDPTGAGDAFRSGLLKGLSMDLDFATVGRIASTAAVYAVEHYGTQEHTYTIKEFCDRFKENFSQECPIK